MKYFSYDRFFDSDFILRRNSPLDRSIRVVLLFHNLDHLGFYHLGDNIFNSDTMMDF